jgi:hypothetical protein
VESHGGTKQNLVFGVDLPFTSQCGEAPATLRLSSISTLKTRGGSGSLQLAQVLETIASITARTVTFSRFSAGFYITDEFGAETVGFDLQVVATLEVQPEAGEFRKKRC